MAEAWPKAVVFDLDGTLIDSVGEIADALNEALRRSDLATFSDDEVRLMIGGGSKVLIERTLAARERSRDTELARQLHGDFIGVYQKASIGRTTIYPHALELLDELATRGLKLAICTNKPAGITEDVLVKLGLRGAFSAVVAGTDALPKKPNPAMLLAALSALGVYPDEAVMIGDSGADVGAAEAAGIPVIAVTYGYTRTPPAELGANLLIDRLEEVVAAFEKLRPV